MSDPNTPPPMDDSEAGENLPSEEASDTPEPTASEPAPEPSTPEPTPSVPAHEEPSPSEPEVAAVVEPVSSATESVSDGVGLGQGTLAESDERTMGLLSHILGGVTSFVGPLIIWLIKKEESPFVNDQGKEALNFQITILIGYVVAGIIAFLPFMGCISGILYPAIGVTSLIFAILGGIEANKGVAYRYPFALRLVS